MDFYTYKLTDLKSSPSDYTLQERIYAMYNDVMAQKEKSCEELKESYKNSLAYASLTNRSVGTHAHLSVTSNVYIDMLNEVRAEISAMRQISPTQYAFSLVKQEGEQIENYLNEKVDSFDQTKDKFVRYENNEGIVAKVSSLFGTRESKMETLSQNLTALAEDIVVGQNSLETWDGLSAEDKVEYIVGRYETQGLTTFDKEGIERFTIANAKVNSFVAEQTTQASTEQ